MAAVVVIGSGHGFRIEVCLVEANLVGLSYHFRSRCFHFYNYFKQLYISNTIECIDIEVGVVYMGVGHVPRLGLQINDSDY